MVAWRVALGPLRHLPWVGATPWSILSPRSRSEHCGALGSVLSVPCPEGTVWGLLPLPLPWQGPGTAPQLQLWAYRREPMPGLASSGIGVLGSDTQAPISSPTLGPTNTLSSPFLSPGVGPRLGGPRQLGGRSPQTVHATKNHAGQPQGPHILFRK